MSHSKGSLHVRIAALAVAIFTAGITSSAQAVKPADPNKPMIKREPMKGEMKKDGTMKDDVSRAAQKWDEKMGDAMKQEKMK